MKLFIVILAAFIIFFIGTFVLSGHFKLKRNFRKVAKKFFVANKDKIMKVNNFKDMSSGDIINHFTNFILKTNKEIVKFLPTRKQIKKSEYLKLFKGFAESAIYPLKFTDKKEESLMVQLVDFYLNELDKDFEKILFVMNVKNE